MKVNNPTIKGKKILDNKKFLKDTINQINNLIEDFDTKHNYIEKETIKFLLENSTKSKYHK